MKVRKTVNSDQKKNGICKTGLLVDQDDGKNHMNGDCLNTEKSSRFRDQVSGISLHIVMISKQKIDKFPH